MEELCIYFHATDKPKKASHSGVARHDQDDRHEVGQPQLRSGLRLLCPMKKGYVDPRVTQLPLLLAESIPATLKWACLFSEAHPFLADVQGTPNGNTPVPGVSLEKEKKRLTQMGILTLHYTPEHCLVHGGFPLFWWKKTCFKWLQNVSFKEPCQMGPSQNSCPPIIGFLLAPTQNPKPQCIAVGIASQVARLILKGPPSKRSCKVSQPTLETGDPRELHGYCHRDFGSPYIRCS